MFPLVRVGAAVSEDVVTSTRLFAIRYNKLVFVYGVIGGNFLFPSVDLNDFTFVWIKFH